MKETKILEVLGETKKVYVMIDGKKVPVRSILVPRIDFNRVKHTNIQEQINKATEELLEVQEGYQNGDIENIKDECFDVITAIVGVLDKLEEIDLQKENLKNIKKLLDRGYLIEV